MTMTRLAAADDALLRLPLEVDREGPSYTYETLSCLPRKEAKRSWCS